MVTLPSQAVVLQLFGQQMPLGNVVLLHPRIAGQFDHVHTVQQRGRDGVQVIGRGDEEHIAQIKGNVQIVVLEALVLLRIQGLQQRGGRVAPEVAGQLVDLIQQQQRVWNSWR